MILVSAWLREDQKGVFKLRLSYGQGYEALRVVVLSSLEVGDYGHPRARRNLFGKKTSKLLSVDVT